MQKVLFIAPYTAKHGEGNVGLVCLKSLTQDNRAKITSIDSNINGKSLIRIVFKLMRLYVKISLNIATTYDILYLSFGRTHNTNIRDILAMLVVKLRNPSARVIIHVHGSEMGANNSFIQTLWYLKAGKLCDKVIILCENHKQFTFGPFFNKYIILPNPCITEQEKIFSNKIAHSESILLLFVSNPIAEKGLDVIINWLQSTTHKTNYILNVIGWSTNDYERVYSKEIPKTLLKNGSVVFHGPLYGAEKQEFFQKSDVFLFPTRYQTEAQPLVLLEALNCNLQIITSRIEMFQFFEQYENHSYWDEKSLTKILKKKRHASLSDSQRALFISEHDLNLYQDRFADVIFS